MEKRFSNVVLATLVAALLVAGSGIAQAATIYQKDGLTYKVKGDWQIQLRQDEGNNQKLDVEYDDLELKNSITYDLEDGLTAFGEVDFGFKNSADKGSAPHLEEAYVGFGVDKFSILVGKTDSSVDGFGVEGAYEEPLGEDAFNREGFVSGDDLILATADLDVVKVIVSHELKAESEASANGTFTDIRINTEISGFELVAAYQAAEDTAGLSIDTYGVSIAYNYDAFGLAADFSETDSDDNSNDMKMYNLYASVKANKQTKLGAGYQYVDYDLATEEVTGWYANATYKFPKQKNVSVFAEICDTDAKNVDIGYLAGARIKF